MGYSKRSRAALAATRAPLKPQALFGAREKKWNAFLNKVKSTPAVPVVRQASDETFRLLREQLNTPEKRKADVLDNPSQYVRSPEKGGGSMLSHLNVVKARKLDLGVRSSPSAAIVAKRITPNTPVRPANDDRGRGVHTPIAQSTPPLLPPPGRGDARPPVGLSPSVALHTPLSQATSLDGLRNFGNTCYMNAVLSLLMNLPTFKREVRRDRPREDASFGAALRLIVSGDIMKGLVAFREAMGTNALFASFKGLGQQDSHEFFHKLLECLEDEQKKVDAQAPLPGLFHGTLERKMVCAHCKAASTKLESFRDVSLDLEDARDSGEAGTPDVPTSRSISDLLDKHFAVEAVNKDCDTCKSSNAPHTIETTIRKLPRVLVLHLKRLSNMRRKTKGEITFGEVLDVGRFCSGAHVEPASPAPRTPEGASGGRGQYELRGVVSHIGTHSFGHYISNVKRKSSWFTYNDETVTATTLEGVQRSEADNCYMLVGELAGA